MARGYPLPEFKYTRWSVPNLAEVRQAWQKCAKRIGHTSSVAELCDPRGALRCTLGSVNRVHFRLIVSSEEGAAKLYTKKKCILVWGWTIGFYKLFCRLIRGVINSQLRINYQFRTLARGNLRIKISWVTN